MSSPFNIPYMRELLQRTGSVGVVDSAGKRLVLTLQNVCMMDNEGCWENQRGLLICYEGEGALFYKGDKKLTKFRLVQAGFSLIVAPTLAELVNAIMVDAWQEQQRSPVSERRLLTANGQNAPSGKEK